MRSTICRFDYELFADYFQFYLQDESAPGDLSDSWTDEAVARLLAVAPGAIGVGTTSNTDVRVIVEVLEHEPELALDAWNHVTECSLDVPSGRIVIAGCTDYYPDAARINVPPGLYRVRVSYGALGQPPDDGFEGDERYQVQLWKAPAIGVRVLKQLAARSTPNKERMGPEGA